MKFTAPLLCVLALVLPAAHLAGQGPSTQVRTIERPVQLTIETYELKNGLDVILSRDPSVPVVAVNLWYHVGSANEQPGRTGFAHLFEHMMFQGSAHVRDDDHFRLIQEAGGTLNGSTSADRTNYYQTVPANFLEQVLWQESDRMGFLLDGVTQEKLDNQRSVVQNERRQSYENVPYGLVGETIAAALYPKGHPYSWPVIGSMADLSAATLEDVQAFFRTYYAPNNASLAIVGDFDPAQTKQWVERYFGDLPSGPPIERPTAAPVQLHEERRLVLEDRVQFPRLYMVWPTPALLQPDDAELDVLGRVLTGDRTSRLTRRLVHEDRIAQTVSSGQSSRHLAGEFRITVQPRPGVELARVRAAIEEELARLLTDPPSERDMARARNYIESSFIRGLETVLDRADQLNAYATLTGDPVFMARDLERYAKVTPAGVQDVARRYLGAKAVVLSVVPQGQTGQALP